MSDSKFLPLFLKSHETVPEEFTYPFYYEPHSLAKRAADELQSYLERHQKDWNHNFGLTQEKSLLSVGKMFGVLVVEDKNQHLGYLRGFSGELLKTQSPEGFVPSLIKDGNDKDLASDVEQITIKISDCDEIINSLEIEKTAISNEHEIIIDQHKEKMKRLKTVRDHKREDSISPEIIKALDQESSDQKKILKALKIKKIKAIEKIENQLQIEKNKKRFLQVERKNILNRYQQDKYGDVFLSNSLGETRSLIEIFKNSPREKIPVGSGQCAAPKLLQFAYDQGLKPLALAEFWWGKSPNAEVRKHKHFYPACNARCKPILSFMLEGLKVQKNPLLINGGKNKTIAMVYQDDHIVIVDKPQGLLSVPGKSIEDSVQNRMKSLFPTSTIIHRLDQETSGLMVLALTKKAQKSLQKQFMTKEVKKTYTAVLDTLIDRMQGEIVLPLRGDYDDLPRQIVCKEHGKEAHTTFKVIGETNKGSRVFFSPLTGRTHQLRIHSAHPEGLGVSIRGDTLYGTKDKRLFLHASELILRHPLTKEVMTFTSEPEF